MRAGFMTRLQGEGEERIRLSSAGEAGSRLSGGQKQLVSLARTVLADPRILILDEPTANVDVITESLIQKGFRELASGRTTFIIAHRFSTVKEADRIVLLEGGRVAGTGTHEELLSANTGYRRLYENSGPTEHGPTDLQGGTL